MKDLRAVVRRLDRDHSFDLIAESEASPALVAELNQISEEWRDGAPERGFTMELGQDVEGTQSDFVLAFARERRRGAWRASCGSSPSTASSPATRWT